jgi:hypothetical protein
MDKNTTRLLIGLGIAFIVIFALVAVGCVALTYIYPTFVARSTPTGPDALHTQAAQTISANMTQTAAIATPTVIGLPPAATPTPTPTATGLPVVQPSPTPTSVPPTTTSIPATPTTTPLPCYWAKFEADVGVEDGANFTPGVQFTKIWRLRNVGSCSWTSDFLLVFAGGERMGGPQSSPIGETVDPGETIDLSVKLVAPDEAGEHRGDWLLSTPGGQEFGLGSGADNPFFVEINVLETGDFAFDLTLNYCTAEWTTSEGDLACPGQAGDEDGFVVLVDDPEIEISRQENEAGLWAQPQHTNDGYLRGEYPAFKIEDGDHFMAIVACLDGADKCDVIFRLSYRVGNGDPVILWEAHEVYDGNFTKVDLNLSSLAGQDVKFILTVFSNGAPDEDQALWLLPRIEEVD